MTTVAEQTQMIRRRLYSGFQSRYNVLLTTMNTSVTTVALQDDFNGLVVGGRLAIGSELMLIRALDASAKTVTVVRGFMGTTKTAHTADDLVEVSPRFFVGDIVDTMREEVRSWGDLLFKVQTAPFSTSSDQRDYDLVGATDPIFLLEVIRTNTVSVTYDNSRSSVEARLIRNSDVASFPSGFAVQLQSPPANGVGHVLAWAETLDTNTWTDTTDLIADVGLQASWLDILTYGTLWRLMSGKEIGRTDIQAGGDIRRAEENPPGYTAKVAGEYMRLRDRRLADEGLELRARYPYRVGL